MNIITRYIARAVLAASVTVWMVLLGIFAFFVFVDELENLDRNQFGLREVATVVVLKLPGLAYDLLPIAALIGALLALGGMNERSEVAIVRAAGMSRHRVVAAALQAALVLVAIAIGLGETVHPRAEREVQALRARLDKKPNALAEQSFWAREGNSYINIRDVRPGGQLTGISIYEFDRRNDLIRAVRAERARMRGAQWQLKDVAETRFDSGQPQVRRHATLVWASRLDPGLIGMVASNPASLSTRQLLRYIEFVEASGQNAERWRHALWRKLIYPLATVVMIFLAVPMVVRSTRAVSSGRRILFGTLLGLAFHVTNQTAAHLGTVFAAPAAMCAVLPTLVLFLIGVALHARTL